MGGVLRWGPPQKYPEDSTALLARSDGADPVARQMLGRRHGSLTGADEAEDLSCSCLDRFEALAEKLRITAIQPDIVSRR